MFILFVFLFLGVVVGLATAFYQLKVDKRDEVEEIEPMDTPGKVDPLSPWPEPPEFIAPVVPHISPDETVQVRVSTRPPPAMAPKPSVKPVKFTLPSIMEDEQDDIPTNPLGKRKAS